MPAGRSILKNNSDCHWLHPTANYPTLTWCHPTEWQIKGSRWHWKTARPLGRQYRWSSKLKQRENLVTNSQPQYLWLGSGGHAQEPLVWQLRQSQEWGNINHANYSHRKPPPDPSSFSSSQWTRAAAENGLYPIRSTTTLWIIYNLNHPYRQFQTTTTLWEKDVFLYPSNTKSNYFHWFMTLLLTPLSPSYLLHTRSLHFPSAFSVQSPIQISLKIFQYQQHTQISSAFPFFPPTLTPLI